MKTLLKILGILIILILTLAFVIPIIFKDRIIEITKEEINNSVEAKVDFDDISLSLFKSFPNFNLSIRGICITGLNEFESDTLAKIESINITLDLFSVVIEKSNEVKKIVINNPDIKINILEDGTANYDIVSKSDDAITETPDEIEESPFNISLKQFEIIDGNIEYNDESLNMFMSLFGFNHNLNGNLSEDKTILRTVSSIDKMDIVYEGVNYFSNTNVNYNANINADLKNEIYTLEKNELKLNELIVNFDGSVSFVDEDINLVLTFNSPETAFKNFLSLIPTVYYNEFASIETSGKLQLDGHIKGVYTNDSYPAFNLNLVIEDAMFKYPDLPKSVTDINITSAISNKGGNLDNTVINISECNLKMGNNPFQIKMLVKTPVSDPDINGMFKGNLDLSTIKEFYPLEEGDDMRGTFVSDITLNGKLSAIENERYDEFTAFGSLIFKDLSYKSSYLEETVKISSAQLNVSPQYLDLVSINTNIGKNDISAQGKLTNYLAYFFKDENLEGTLTSNSDYFDISSFMTEESDEEMSAVSSTDETVSIIQVPGNIDFKANATFGKLVYDGMEMENARGSIIIKDQKAVLKDFKMNLLEGNMNINGSYSTIDIEKPTFDFELDINELDIQKSYNTFNIISQYLPLAKKTTGKFSSKLIMKSVLGQDMLPMYETITGEGELFTSGIKIKDINTINKITEALKIEKLKSLDIDKIQLQFEFVDGKVLIDPFDIIYNSYTANLSGWTGYDQAIDYVMSLNIPRSEFGSEANNVLANLTNEANAKGVNFNTGETISLDVLIGGTLTNPTIKTGLKDIGRNLVENAKEQVKKEIDKKKEEIGKEAKQRAQKIIDDANKQADMLVAEAEKNATAVRLEAAKAAQELKDEADKQAKKLEAEGKKNGFLAEIAAKESAKKIRQEADKQAGGITSEGNKQANAIVNKAKQQADRIKKKAQMDADKLTGKI